MTSLCVHDPILHLSVHARFLIVLVTCFSLCIKSFCFCTLMKTSQLLSKCFVVIKIACSMFDQIITSGALICSWRKISEALALLVMNQIMDSCLT